MTRLAVALMLAYVAVLFSADIVEGMVTCQPNLKIIRGCNTCICDAEGSALKCTKKACGPNQEIAVPADAVSGWDTVCKPKSVFEVKSQCSKCKCQSSGNGFECDDIEGCTETNPQEFDMAAFLPFKLPTV